MSGTFETELDVLYRALASGALTVKYDSHSVTYGSADDLLTRIRFLEGRVKVPPRAGLASFRRGDRA